MLRSVTLGVMVFVVAACALVEPPPPPGTRRLAVEVQNGFAVPANLTVETTKGPIPGAAQPASVLPRSTALIDVFIPFGSDWMVKVNGQDVLRGPETVDVIEQFEWLIGVDPEGNAFSRCKC